MSRSKHTVPPRIRAPRRVRALDEPRGHGDPSARQALLRELKEWGIVGEGERELPEGEGPGPLPRVRVVRARSGFWHPAGRAEIVRVLRFFGAVCTYGLRSIELRQGEGLPGSRICLGRLFVPGRVVLYDQPLSPWVLPGRLPEREAARLQRAGALVEGDGEGMFMMVIWPGETLRDFMLFDVLLHEIGHHLVQQYRGKRTARVLRTRDHEAFAERFALRCRELSGAGATEEFTAETQRTRRGQ